MTQQINTQQEMWLPSKRTLWTIRIVLIGLFLIWLSVAIYLRHNVNVSRAKVEQNRLEAQRQEERIQREAAYRQQMQQHQRVPQTRNVFDGR